MAASALTLAGIRTRWPCRKDLHQESPLSTAIAPSPETERPDPGALVPPEFTPLPEDATPEEKDRHWYTTLYQGDRVPQLTFRAVAMSQAPGWRRTASHAHSAVNGTTALAVAAPSTSVLAIESRNEPGARITA